MIMYHIGITSYLLTLSSPHCVINVMNVQLHLEKFFFILVDSRLLKHSETVLVEALSDEDY